MFLKKFDTIKHYLNLHLTKDFIQVSLTLYSFLVFFIKKLDKKILLYIDYWKVNAIIKKDHDPILFIKKVLVQLESTKYFIKIDIC